MAWLRRLNDVTIATRVCGGLASLMVYCVMYTWLASDYIRKRQFHLLIHPYLGHLIIGPIMS